MHKTLPGLSWYGDSRLKDDLKSPPAEHFSPHVMDGATRTNPLWPPRTREAFVDEKMSLLGYMTPGNLQGFTWCDSDDSDT